MRNTGKIMVAAVAVSLFSAVSASAGDAASGGVSEKAAAALNTSSEYSRLCGLADMEGFWKVVKWTAFYEIKAKDWKNSVYMKHQWILIDSKGALRTIGSNKKMDASDAERKLHSIPIVMLLSFERKGFATVISTKKGLADTRWRCSVVTKDVSIKDIGVELKKGDVIMTMLAPNGNVVYFRQMRRP